MKEIVYDSFKKTLHEVSVLSAIIKNEKASKEELQEGLFKASDLLFSSYSNLNILTETIKNHVSIGYKITPSKKKPKKELTKIEVKIIYNKLVELIKEELQRGTICPKENLILENQYASMGLIFYEATISKNIIKFNKDLLIYELSKKDLLSVLGNYFKEITEYIEDLLLYNIFMVFDKPNILYVNEIECSTDYKKEYIDSWVNCDVKISKISRFSRIDYWSEIFDLNLDFEHIERIEKYQEKIFYERVHLEVGLALNDIFELEESQQILQINKELDLINGFFSGDLSKLTVKRLKEIIRFSKPKKLILTYDQLKKNNYYLASECLIYSIGKPRIYSKYFVASFFIEYLKALSVELENLSKESKINDDNVFYSFNELVSKEKQNYILKLLEDLSITVDGKSVLSPRKKGALRGVVESLREKMIIPNIGIAKLCNLIAFEINLELNSELDASTTSENYKKEASKYINNNPLH